MADKITQAQIAKAEELKRATNTQTPAAEGSPEPVPTQGFEGGKRVDAADIHARLTGVGSELQGGIQCGQVSAESLGQGGVVGGEDDGEERLLAKYGQ